MGPATGDEIRRNAVHMNIHDLVRELNENVGATTVQTMVGISDLP